MSAPPYPVAASAPVEGAAAAAPYPTGPSSHLAAVGGPAQFLTPVQLSISCTNLVDKDVLSKSDPVCIVDLLQGRIDASQGKFVEVGRTEFIKDNLNPQFAKSVTVNYFFEEVQHVRFMLYDVDDESRDVRTSGGGELLGEVTAQLSQIVMKSPLELNLNYQGKKTGFGKIKITAEEVSAVDERIDMTWAGTKLDKMDFFGKSDPFLEFARENPDGSFSVVHRTEVIKNTLNPRWQPFSVGSQQLCNSDDRRRIRITCQDWNKSGEADFIGCCDVKVADLRKASLPVDLELVNSAKAKKKKSYRNSGVLHLQHLDITKKPTFLEYVSGGLELNFVVGVDFTGSNGDRRKPTSLHYLSPTGNMNEYQQALWAVGSVCEQYDTDKMFPAYGFGAKVPPNFEFSNIFNLSVGSPTPECHGVAGIQAAYQQACSQVQLWGPTNAAPIINAVATLAEEEHRRIVSQKLPCRTYQILLLMTDGILTDMDNTKLAVIKASRLPMSIIIVGVGKADFSDMEELDADDGLLRIGNVVAMRDIVQFVPFSQFAMQPPEVLAKEVLAEVPTQVVEYMYNYGLPVMSAVAGAPHR